MTAHPLDDFCPHHLIHRGETRQAFYEAAGAISWSDDLQCWVTGSPATIKALLRDPAIEVIDFRTVFAHIAEAIGIDLSGALSVFDYVPLGLNGREHIAARRDEMLMIKEATPAALDAFRAALTDAVAGLEARGGGDLVGDVLMPATRAMMTALSGVDTDTGDAAFSLSQIFDQKLGLRKRRRISERLAEIVDDAARRMPRDEARMRVAVSVVGADSILGTLGQSFLHDARRNAGRRFSEFDWSPRMPRTGVPYVDRIAAGEIAVGDALIRKGDRVRLYMDNLGLDDPTAYDLYYGIGAHVCLGKALSISAWDRFTECLGGIGRVPHLGEAALRPADLLFNVATKIPLELSDD